MRIHTAPLLFTALLLMNCNSTTQNGAAVTELRTYQGMASVGDFMTITIDANAQTIAYADLSNKTSGTVPYTVNPDGTYTLADPQGNLVGAYEVPNYALLIQAAKTGANANTPALITAVESGQISLSRFEGQSYNYMQFRTTAGGLEVGSLTVNGDGLGAISSFWPYGAYNLQNQGAGPFNKSTIDVAQAQLDSSGTFLTVPELNNTSVSDYVFGTANGVFAMDTGNGAILGLKKAPSKDFDPSVAGTYKAIFYQKTNARMRLRGRESGISTLTHATLTVTGTGHVTVTDPQGNQVLQAKLVPVADTSYLYGRAGELADPCNGVFTFRLITAKSQQDVFVTFMGQAMLFASFSANLPWAQGSTYNYLYGVGLK